MSGRAKRCKSFPGHPVRPVGRAPVMINMHIDVAGQSVWRAYINPDNRTAWFTGYGAWLVHYGQIAQAAGASGICIGTELIDVTNPTVHPSNTAMWVRYIIPSAAVGVYRVADVLRAARRGGAPGGYLAVILTGSACRLTSVLAAVGHWVAW